VPELNLIHLNGNLLCGIDIETTGLDFEQHDIYELAIIPIDDKFHRNINRKWLDLVIRPSRPDNIDWSGVGKTKNKSRIERAMEKGLDSHTAMTILDRWFDEQNLGSKRVAPVGHNYSFEARFLRAWLGSLNYETKFADYEVRDTMVIAKFLNDMADFRGEEKFPYPKANLTYLASTLKVEHDYGRAHTALADVATTIDVYRRQMEELNKIMLG